MNPVYAPTSEEELLKSAERIVAETRRILAELKAPQAVWARVCGNQFDVEAFARRVAKQPPLPRRGDV